MYLSLIYLSHYDIIVLFTKSFHSDFTIANNSCKIHAAQLLHFFKHSIGTESLAFEQYLKIKCR